MFGCCPKQFGFESYLRPGIKIIIRVEGCICLCMLGELRFMSKYGVVFSLPKKKNVVGGGTLCIENNKLVALWFTKRMRLLVISYYDGHGE